MDHDDIRADGDNDDDDQENQEEEAKYVNLKEKDVERVKEVF